MGQAVQIGKKMKAKYMILTHFSARYPKVRFKIYNKLDLTLFRSLPCHTISM